MQPEATDLAPNLHSSSGFSGRANQIFGALGGSSLDGASESKNAPWTVSQDTVFRSSKEAYSSDEDEEAKEIDRRQKDILPESMQELEGKCHTSAHKQEPTSVSNAYLSLTPRFISSEQDTFRYVCSHQIPSAQ